MKHLIPHPEGDLSVDDRWLLALSVLFFVGGLSSFQYRVMKRLAPERVLCITAAGAWLPGLVVVAGVAVLLGAMQAITWRRFQRGALAHTLAAR